LSRLRPELPVEDDRHGPVVHKLDLHVRTEAPEGHRDSVGAQSVAAHPRQRLGDAR
jgi:hypothetical protein